MACFWLMRTPAACKPKHLAPGGGLCMRFSGVAYSMQATLDCCTSLQAVSPDACPAAAQVGHYIALMAGVQALAAQDCLALINTNKALAHHGLSQQLHGIVLETLQKAPELADVRSAGGPCLKWHPDTDAALQYVWDWFADAIAASQEPLSQVPQPSSAVALQMHLYFAYP